jgi:uncharacterized protein YwqG
MNFYQLKAVKQHPWGEHWSIRSDVRLNALHNQHVTGGIPVAEDIAGLPIRVYADTDLTDALTMSPYHDSFFVSERLKLLLDGFKIAEGRVYFFENNQVQWRDNTYRYYWLQTVYLRDEADTYDPDYDLFIRNGNYPHKGLICSERLKTAIEAAGITGLSFTAVDLLDVPQAKHQPPQKAVPTFAIHTDRWNGDPTGGQALFGPQYTDIKAFHDTMYAELGELTGPMWFGGTPEEQAAARQQMEDQIQALKTSKATLQPLLEAQTRRSFVMRYGLHQAVQQVTNSRFFGQPLLPEEFVWPRTESGQALLFVAQINLSELPVASELPQTGLLSFFIDMYGASEGWPVEAGRHRVLYFPDVMQLQPAPFPTDLQINADFESLRLQFDPCFDIPDDRWTETFLAEEKELYDAFYSEFIEMDNLYLSGVRLLGCPRCVQGYVGTEIVMRTQYNNDWEQYHLQETAVKAAIQPWRPLFQFRADQVGLGDILTDPEVYFMIQEADLAALCFEGTEVCLQGT